MIEIKELTKRYSGRDAISELSFTVEDGMIYGLLGPNGAGKSTTMNIMTGYLAPTSGTVTVDGLDIFEDAEDAKKKIGYLPEQPPLYTHMTITEFLTFVAELKEVKKENIPSEIAAAIEKTGLESVKGRLIKNLSKGYRQRVGIAQAIIGDPKVIILDEPTVGLDPKQIIEIRELIRSLKTKHTVILSSHLLGEVAAVCDRIIIISHGRLVAEDTPENLSKKLQSGSEVRLTVRAEEETVSAALDFIGTPSFSESRTEGYIDACIHTDGTSSAKESIFFALAKNNIPLISMTEESASLEEIFLELTSDDAAALPSAGEAEQSGSADDSQEDRQ